MYFLSNRKIIMHAFHVLMPQYYRSTFWIMGLLPRITQTRLLLMMVVVLCGVCLGACLCVYVCCSTKYYNTVWLYHMIYSYFCILSACISPALILNDCQRGNSSINSKSIMIVNLGLDHIINTSTKNSFN